MKQLGHEVLRSTSTLCSASSVCIRAPQPVCIEQRLTDGMVSQLECSSSGWMYAIRRASRRFERAAAANRLGFCGGHAQQPPAPLGCARAPGLAHALHWTQAMDKTNPRRSVLTVARAGAVLIDLESGITLGADSPKPRYDRKDGDDELTDLPSLVQSQKTKSPRDT